MPLVDLSSTEDRPARQPRASVRHLDISATWDELVTAEPKLQAFMDEVRAISGTSHASCSDATWYGWNGDPRRGVKARLRKFLGGESGVFFAAYRALYAMLPICRHCLERDPREADLEAHLVSRLVRLGIRPVDRQVRTGAGIADVVTPDTVYEVKLYLTRVSLFQAVGQVSVYAACLGKPRRVIAGYYAPGTEALIEAVKLAGVEVELW